MEQQVSAGKWMYDMLTRAHTKVEALEELVGWGFRFMHDAQLEKRWEHHSVCGTITGVQGVGRSEMRGFLDTDGKVVLATNGGSFLVPFGSPCSAQLAHVVALRAEQGCEGWHLVYFVVQTGKNYALEGTLRLTPPKSICVEVQLKETRL